MHIVKFQKSEIYIENKMFNTSKYVLMVKLKLYQIRINISNKPISNNIVMIFVEFIQIFPNISRILTVPHGLQTFTDPTSQDEGRRQ